MSKKGYEKVSLDEGEEMHEMVIGEGDVKDQGRRVNPSKNGLKSRVASSEDIAAGGVSSMDGGTRVEPPRRHMASLDDYDDMDEPPRRETLAEAAARRRKYKEFQRATMWEQKKYAVYLAIGLFLAGSILVTIGALLLTGHIESPYWDRGYQLIILGGIMFLPGS